MGMRTDFAGGLLASARRMVQDNVRTLILEEALSSAGGYRSILGVLKHIGGWTRVYWSYAFEHEPRHWEHIDWPRGLRDTVDASDGYVQEVIGWIDQAMAAWEERIAELADDALGEQRPLHWGGSAPLERIVVMAAQHVTYHVGELNMLLSITRQEAWEYGEEVEENHIATYGHAVRSQWMTDEYVRERDEILRSHATSTS